MVVEFLSLEAIFLSFVRGDQFSFAINLNEVDFLAHDFSERIQLEFYRVLCYLLVLKLKNCELVLHWINQWEKLTNCGHTSLLKGVFFLGGKLNNDILSKFPQNCSISSSSVN